MSSRDLLSRRNTQSPSNSEGHGLNPSMYTTWEYSPLIMAALKGHIAVLDGIQNLNPGTLAFLQSLIHDRQISLPDGSKLMDTDSFQALMTQTNLTKDQLREKQIFEIPSSFRIIATAGPISTYSPTSSSSPSQWLTEEVFFNFILISY